MTSKEIGDKKDELTKQLQAERRKRGENFQLEIARSWGLIPKSWRMTIPDGRGGTRPADQITILEDVNILAELKRTKGEKFEISFLRPPQLKGLIDFSSLHARNFGLVFISFLNEEVYQDETYAISIQDAIKFMRSKKRKFIWRHEFLCLKDEIGAVELPLIEPLCQTEDKRYYDLRGLVEKCKSQLAKTLE